MRLEINGIKLAPGQSEKLLAKKAAKALACKEDSIKDIKILKKPIDARKKNDVFILYTISAEVKAGEKYLSRKGVKVYAREAYVPPVFNKAGGKGYMRPVIAGSGPAGLFAALILAQAGLCPIIIERGQALEEREKSVEAFFENGIFNPESNESVRYQGHFE